MATKSWDVEPRIYIRGWEFLIVLNRFMKKGLEDAKTSLCASNCLPSSHARVTSAISLSDLSSRNEEIAFSLKSFHCKQSFSVGSMLALGRFHLCLVITTFCKPLKSCSISWGLRLSAQLAEFELNQLSEAWLDHKSTNLIGLHSFNSCFLQSDTGWLWKVSQIYESQFLECNRTWWKYLGCDGNNEFDINLCWNWKQHQLKQLEPERQALASTWGYPTFKVLPNPNLFTTRQTKDSG